MPVKLGVFILFYFMLAPTAGKMYIVGTKDKAKGKQGSDYTYNHPPYYNYYSKGKLLDLYIKFNA